MTSLRSNSTLGGRAGGARAPWFVSATVAAAALRGLGDVCRNVCPSGGDSEMGCLEVEWCSSKQQLPAGL